MAQIGQLHDATPLRRTIPKLPFLDRPLISIPIQRMKKDTKNITGVALRVRSLPRDTFQRRCS
jgi:hypothetical protein